VIVVIIGDKVKWTEKRVKSRTITMNVKSGTVVDFIGDSVSVKMANGKTALVPASWLRLENEPTEIQDLLEALRERYD
jgi:hypothetical protein